MKNFKSLYGFGGRCLKIRDVCMDFEPYFKVHNLVSVHPKSIILGQMTNLNMIFHVVVSVYRLVKIWISPQFPAEFPNGQLRYPHLQTFLTTPKLPDVLCAKTVRPGEPVSMNCPSEPEKIHCLDITQKNAAIEATKLQPLSQDRMEQQTVSKDACKLSLKVALSQEFHSCIKNLTTR